MEEKEEEEQAEEAAKDQDAMVEDNDSDAAGHVKMEAKEGTPDGGANMDLNWKLPLLPPP